MQRTLRSQSGVSGLARLFLREIGVGPAQYHPKPFPHMAPHRGLRSACPARQHGRDDRFMLVMRSALVLRLEKPAKLLLEDWQAELVHHTNQVGVAAQFKQRAVKFAIESSVGERIR